MCLNLGILKQNDTNMQAFIDESLDNVLPKFSSVLNISNILLDFFALTILMAF